MLVRIKMSIYFPGDYVIVIQVDFCLNYVCRDLGTFVCMLLKLKPALSLSDLPAKEKYFGC